MFERNFKEKRFMKRIIAAAVVAAIAVTGMYAAPNRRYIEHDAGALIMEYPDTSDQYYDEETKSLFYDFGDSRTYGLAYVRDGYLVSGTEDSEEPLYVNYDQQIDFEAAFGMKIECTEKIIKVIPYSHTDINDGMPEIGLSIVMKGGSCSMVKNYGEQKYGQAFEINIKDLDEGFHCIYTKFALKDSGQPNRAAYVDGYVRIKDGKAQTCRRSGNSNEEMIREEINRWNYYMGDAAPEDYISNKDITYPTSGTHGACNHVKEWEAVAESIVGEHDDWSDEMKVYAFVDYLAKNIAYDDYKFAHRISRAAENHDYTNDENFTLKNNVGVCWDYTNILAIMCRHYEIPCTSVEVGEWHTFNAVYLNNRWMGIDVTQLVRYRCDTKDTSKEKWHKTGSAGYSSYGSMYTARITGHDGNIWTMEKGLGLK